MARTAKETFLNAYDEHFDAIYRHCFFRVFEKAKAEELTQETFMRFWRFLESGGRVENARAFLYRTATNAVIDETRKKKEESLDKLLESVPSLEPADDGHRKIERNAMLGEIRQALAHLEDGERELITLRYVSDLDPKDIAEVADITANHVSVKLNRALEKLRKKINPQ